MSKNKSYIVFLTSTGEAIASFSSPNEPIINEGEDFIVGVCADINNCVINENREVE